MIAECNAIEPGQCGLPRTSYQFRVELFGETALSATGNFRFKRGISSYPTFGQSIQAVTRDDLNEVYGLPFRRSVKVGVLHQNKDIPINIDVDELISKHFAILGSTGAGKSCSLVVVLQAILDKYPHGHVILIDPHDEYKTAFQDRSEYIDVRSISLPYWLLNFEETKRVLCQGDSTQVDLQSQILFNCITSAKLEYLSSDNRPFNITVDTPTPYRLSRVQELINEEMGKLDKPGSSLPYLAILARIEQLKSDKRFDFMFSDFIVHDNFAEILSRILRIPSDGKPITILNLAGAPSDIVNVLISLVARIIFDFAVWSDKANTPPVLLVCEEAHRYVSRDEQTSMLPAGRAIARIAQEGRKYGIGLGIVTQRPADISQRILSQCNTLFCLRLTTSADQEFVNTALPENDLSLFKMLPSLRTRDAVVVGDAVSMPMRLRFNMLQPNQMPQRQSLPVSQSWEKECFRRSLISDVVNRWRCNARD